jgi:hypothetical protein
MNQQIAAPIDPSLLQRPDLNNLIEAVREHIPLIREKEYDDEEPE